MLNEKIRSWVFFRVDYLVLNELVMTALVLQPRLKHTLVSAIFSPTRPNWAELVIESPCPTVCGSVCGSVCLSAPSSAVFSRPLIGPQVT